jgi:hypothetical protein
MNYHLNFILLATSIKISFFYDLLHPPILILVLKSFYYKDGSVSFNGCKDSMVNMY